MKAKIIKIIFSSLFLSSCSKGFQDITLSDTVEIKLTHIEDFTFNLSVKNKGNRSIYVPHFNPEIYEQYGLWGGFSFFVTKSDGKHRFVDMGRFKNPNVQDYIHLHPNEKYEEIFNLENLICMDSLVDNENILRLRDSGIGEYHVRADFAIVKEGSAQYPRKIKIRLWGAVDSNIIIIKKE